MAADGVLRCLPLNRTGNAYADPGCHTPVVVVQQTGCAPTHAAPPSVIGVDEQISTSACGPQYKTHELAVGGAHPLTAVYYLDPVGNCQLTPPAVYQGSDVFDVGPEVAPDAFVELATSTPP